MRPSEESGFVSAARVIRQDDGQQQRRGQQRTFLDADGLSWCDIMFPFVWIERGVAESFSLKCPDIVAQRRRIHKRPRKKS